MRLVSDAIGRFVSADSIVPQLSNAQVFNRYSYVANSPIVYTDPSGHSFLDDIGNWCPGAASPVGRHDRVFGTDSCRCRRRV